MTGRVKKRVSQSARLEHLARRRVDVRMKAPRRAPPRSPPLERPGRHRTTPELPPQPDRLRPSGSGRRSIRLTGRRSPAPPGRRWPGGDLSAAHEDASCSGPTPRWSGTHSPRIRPASIAWSIARATSRSVRPSRTSVLRFRAISDSAAAARRSANDFTRIFNHPSRGDDTRQRGSNVTAGTAACHCCHPATVTSSASKPTRPPAISARAPPASVTSYRQRHRLNEDRSDLPRLDQVPRDPDVPAIDDELGAAGQIQQQTGRAAKATQIGEVGRCRHDERIEIVRSVVAAEALEPPGPIRERTIGHAYGQTTDSAIKFDLETSSPDP